VLMTYLGHRASSDQFGNFVGDKDVGRDLDPYGMFRKEAENL
jgi:hypothetical protein